MNWSNVALILSREIRDQLRDRRTLFMIAVLPIVLYPLLGMSFFQIAQFRREHINRVLVVGAPRAGEAPPLVEDAPAGDGRHFSALLFSDAKKVELLEVERAVGDTRAMPADEGVARARAAAAVEAGRYDVALYFPPDFVQRLTAFRKALAEKGGRAAKPVEGATPTEVALQVPSPDIIYTSATDRSQIAYARLAEVLRRWTEQVGNDNLQASGLPPEAARPFEPKPDDMAQQTGRLGVAAWSKLLPVLLLVWAVTGAFYPAIDLCAGEKERGTLETLLCSPARRSEIVLGKLLTIMAFSILTAALNLLSMGITGTLLMSQLPGFGPPPLLAPLWLLLALVPVSALFSALSLALAAFAKSTKEGQYYLMPLLLVTMPLAIIPAHPGVELTLGNSLIPVTGMMLLLRSLLEGNWHALQYAPPVLAVTLAGCALAVRWAVDQFNSEAVLFREGERLDVGMWLRHLVRDRQATPNVAMAVFCGATVLVLKFFLSLALHRPESFRDFGVQTLVLQLAVILTPALLMSVMLTNSPRQTLLLRMPRGLALPAAALLAFAVHPLYLTLHNFVLSLYPIAPAIAEALNEVEVLVRAAPLWQVLVVFALVPPLCEELAFRGFVLSGFRHVGHKWRAIVYAALFFGVSHGVFQQWVGAALLGCVIGYLAIQSGSILPGLVFHVVHNGLMTVVTRMPPETLDRIPVLRAMLNPDVAGVGERIVATVLALAIAAALAWWFHRLPYRKSAEETLQEAIDRGTRGQSVAAASLTSPSGLASSSPCPDAAG